MKYFALALMVFGVSPPPARADVSDCATIEDATRRLDCYDQQANRQRPPGEKKTTTQEPVVEQTAPAKSAPAKSAPVDDPRDEALFDKRPKNQDDIPDSIESRIVEVTINNAGKNVMTLANGMVWIEREPSWRRIYDGQDVVIDKRRWSFSMHLLDEKRRVTVQRVE